MSDHEIYTPKRQRTRYVGNKDTFIKDKNPLVRNDAGC